jgi:quercetin dioxygenase-like cupin family protein
MLPGYDDLMVRRFEETNERRVFERGKFEVVKIGNLTIGRATYEPGWKWSTHVRTSGGPATCQVEHIGFVVSGSAAVHMDDGRHYEMKAGDVFFIAPGHDSWVVGNEPYVSIHFVGAEHYAQK